MKASSKSTAIAKFIVDNPELTQAEIAQHFEVTRQRIEQVYKNYLTETQKEDRKNYKIMQILDPVLPLVEEKTPKAVISAVTGFSLNQIDSIFKHPKIVEILEKQEKEKNDYIDQLSADWLSGMGLSELKQKYGWEWCMESCSGHISALRRKYPEKFPNRIHNRTPAQEQFNKYQAMKNEGKTSTEIAAALGYKNVGSMKSAFHNLNKNHEPATT